MGVVRWLPTPPGSELHHSQLCSARRHFVPRGHKPSQAAGDMCRKPSFPLLCQHGLAAMAAFSSWSTQLLNANTPFRLVNNYLAGLCYDYMAWSGHDQALPTLTRHPLRHLPLLLAPAWVMGLLRHTLAPLPGSSLCRALVMFWLLHLLTDSSLAGLSTALCSIWWP